jgi:hypothetical protein
LVVAVGREAGVDVRSDMVARLVVAVAPAPAWAAGVAVRLGVGVVAWLVMEVVNGPGLAVCVGMCAPAETAVEGRANVVAFAKPGLPAACGTCDGLKPSLDGAGPPAKRAPPDAAMGWTRPA